MRASATLVSHSLHIPEFRISSPKSSPDPALWPLLKSCRSTIQITRFLLRVRPNPDIIPIERHGEEPVILATAHLVKGLEFDEVLIPDVDEDNYRTSIAARCSMSAAPGRCTCCASATPASQAGFYKHP